VKEEALFCAHLYVGGVNCFIKVPGRGLEPLRISPPDPKSGASANSATLAEVPPVPLAQILAQSAVFASLLHVSHLKAVDKQSIETGKVVGAFLQCGRMRLLEVARHRARHVHRVLHPRSWSRRFKMESGCHDCTSQICARHCGAALQGSSSLSPIIRFACHAQISNRREFLRGFTPACAPLWTLGHSLTLRSQRVTQGFAVLQPKFIRP
jgi:hypothetical protein